jgi:hypothetical protein
MVMVHRKSLHDGCRPTAVTQYGTPWSLRSVHRQKIIDKINKKKLKLLQIVHFFFLSLRVSNDALSTQWVQIA